METNQGQAIESLLQQAYATRVSNLNKSIQMAEEALVLSRELNNETLIAKSLNHLSLFHMIKGEPSESQKLAEEAISYYKKLNDEKGIADAKYNLAGIYYKTDNFHLGLINLIDCLVVYKKYDDFHNQSRVQKSLGTIYEYFGDEKNAVDAYEYSIEAAKKARDKGLESNAYNPLSGIYLKKGEISKALEVIEKAIAMKKESNDIRGLAFSLYGRAKVYTKTKQYKEAEEDLKKALEIHIEAGDKLGTAMAYRKLGQLYMAAGRVDDAISTLKQCVEFSKKYHIAIVLFKAHYHLYEIYRLQNNIENALTHLESYLKQKEAVINAQTLQVIENYELIKKVETMEKEAKMEKEKAEILKKQELAERASKMKQEFLSTMSHEIRTPLNAVITISSLLQEKADPDEKELVDSLRFAANNLLHLVNDILDFTKLDTGNTKLLFRPTEFKPLIENVTKTYDSLARAKGLQLFLNIDTALAQYYELDDTKLSQILGNLISNAIKYTETGRVSVEIEKTGETEGNDKIRFKVSDTGIGIAEDNLEDVFESFSQIQAVTTRKEGGTGLGLAIVKKLVALHGSTIHLNSEIGKGSEFYFELQLKPADSHYKKQDKLVSDELGGKYALLAEDNMLNAMVAMKLLSKWNVKADHAKNGIEAVDKSQKKHYDFILMDIHMPEMNGFDATKKIRCEQNLNSNTPIFALTADITAEYQDEYAEYFNGFLRKPIEINKMREALASA